MRLEKRLGYAIMKGYLGVVEWFAEGGISLDTDIEGTVDSTFAEGHLNTIKWLDEKGYLLDRSGSVIEIYEEYAKIAAEYGRILVII